MKTLSISLFILVLIFSASVFSQTTQSTPVQTDEDDVVKISTDLVQIDAVITDKKGNPVTNLTASDFEILQDGKPQNISGFSYVNTENGKRILSAVFTKKTGKNLPLPPPAVIRSTESKRLLTFVVDDGSCGVTFAGMRAAREGLKKFVMEQMQPSDLVAIYLTHSGSSLLQQYTSDKSRLLGIINKIRGFSTINCLPRDAVNNTARNDSILEESVRDRENRRAVDSFNKRGNNGTTAGVIRYAINGLRRVGGRKILFVLSDSLSPEDEDRLTDSFPHLSSVAELANRNSVAINTIDVRGLIAPGAQASDNFKIDDPKTLDNNSTFISDFRFRHPAFEYIARETGGKFYKSSNFLDYSIREALKVETGYYLIGYQPEAETFKGKQFHKIEIKLKRPDLIVGSRSGFSSITDQEIIPKPRSGDSELYQAVVAPLPNVGLDLRLTAFFANTVAEGNFARTLLYIDGKQPTFSDEPNAMKKAVFDVFAVTLNEKNEVVDEFNRTHTIKFPAANLAEVQRNGLIYSADVPLKKAGAYNFRIAVRDAASKLLGSATQQIDVPELKKGKLFLSGLTIGEVTIKDNKPEIPSIEKSANAFATVSSGSIPAIRQFHSGAILGYSYKIYNAQLDKTSNQPKLTVQVRLYRDEQLVLDSKPQIAQLELQSDLTRIADYGYLKLTPEISAGDYALQIIIKDLQSNKTTSQWIDFEVIR